MKNILLLLLALFSFNYSFSTHIVGGNFVITQTGPNTYTITVKVYRDCCSSCSAMPTSVTVGIYDKVTNAQTSTLTINSPTVTNIVLGDACYTPTGICVEEGIFTQTNVNIPNNPNGYYVQTQLYARNNIIANITNPGNTGMSFYAEIPNPALAGMNSSPDFGPYPSDGYFCVNNTKQLDFSVVDPDGDSLVYSLVDPLQSVGTANGTSAAPYSPVTWLAPYSLANICGGTPPMYCNSSTGIVYATPSALGTYVFAVRIEEYRNGVKIGEVRRDVQYHALNCIFDDLPSIALPDTVMIEVLSSGCFDIVVIDPDVTDTVSIFVTSNTFGLGASTFLPEPYQVNPDTLYLFTYIDSITGQLDTVLLPAPTYVGGAYFGTGGVGLRYCWTTECSDLEVQGFQLNVEAYSLGCSGDTNSFSRVVPLRVVPPSGDLTVIPNVFTPNGDGINDLFKIHGAANPCWDTIHVEIYNRWGQKVYESDEVEFTWDGKNMQGKDVNEGTYFVIIGGKFGDEDVLTIDPVKKDKGIYPLTLLRSK